MVTMSAMPAARARATMPSSSPGKSGKIEVAVAVDQRHW
jgi:hypothetical protein